MEDGKLVRRDQMVVLQNDNEPPVKKSKRNRSDYNVSSRGMVL